MENPGDAVSNLVGPPEERVFSGGFSCDVETLLPDFYFESFKSVLVRAFMIAMPRREEMRRSVKLKT